MAALLGTKIAFVTMRIMVPPGMTEEEAMATIKNGLAVTLTLGELQPDINVAVLDSSKLPQPDGTQ